MIMRIELEDANPEKIFDNYGITKRTYESCIKRSPRLQFIREKIKHYKQNKIDVPDLYFEIDLKKL